MREIFFTTVASLIFTPILFVGLFSATAQVRQSSSYRIQSDSINFGGGLASSTGYTQESTAGEVGTGELSSTNYSLKTGYQQMQEVYISISGATAVTLSPSIPGVSGGISNGSTTVTVTTDSASGYQLTIAASQSPALKKGVDSIADYVPVGAPDFSFVTNSSDSHLGYSPSGVDVVQRFKDNGAACNVGVLETALACWDGLSPTAVAIAESTSANQPNGATTTVYFRVGVGGSVLQPPGTYTATTTLTALPL